MRNEVIIGMAVGAILGAVLVEGNKPAADLVSKGKQAVKEKVCSMTKKHEPEQPGQ